MCRYKKRKRGHTKRHQGPALSQGEDRVSTRQEDGHLQAGEGPQEKPNVLTPVVDLGLLASTTVKKCISIV